MSSHVPPASIPSPTSAGRTHLRLALDLRRLVRVTRANIECEQEAPALVIPLVGLECHLKIQKLVFALREAAHDLQSFAKVATAIRRQRAEVCVVAPCVSRARQRAAHRTRNVLSCCPCVLERISYLILIVLARLSSDMSFCKRSSPGVNFPDLLLPPFSSPVFDRTRCFSFALKSLIIAILFPLESEGAV